MKGIVPFIKQEGVNAMTNNSYISESYIKRMYREYLMEKVGVNRTSASNYLTSLNKVSKEMKSRGVVKNSIYEISNLHLLLSVKPIALECAHSFTDMSRGNKSNCVVTIRHYYDFAAQFSKFSHKSLKEIRVHNAHLLNT